MKEAIFILFVITVLVVLTAFLRYRKHLATMLNVWRMLKMARQPNRPGENRIEGSERVSGSLVNCAKCGVWVSETRAIRLGKNSYYCSADCVEKSAKMA